MIKPLTETNTPRRQLFAQGELSASRTKKPAAVNRVGQRERHIVDPQPFTIDNLSEANAYLADLLQKPEFQSMSVVEARCAALIRDPVVRAYFLAQAAEMLDEIKG